ncbi:hypothetical protein PHYSODRAFT_423987, partial [Phytophthora sojae]
MRSAFLLAIVTLASFSVISTAAIQNEPTTPVPATKLRTITDVPTPPQTPGLADGKRRLGIFDFLFPKSTPAPPRTPHP